MILVSSCERGERFDLMRIIRFFHAAIFCCFFFKHFTPFGFMRSLHMLKTEKLDVIKLHVDTCACTVGLLKQDQRWRSAASLSQQSACPRFYLRIRSSLLYLTAEVGRPLLLHDGSCRPLEAERRSFQNWLKSVPLFTEKKTMFSVLSSAD